MDIATVRKIMPRPNILDGFEEREMTVKEFNEWKELLAEIDLQKTAQAAKAAARQSALAKLAELGLTEEEIAAL